MELPHSVLYLDTPAQAGHLSGFLAALSRHPGGISGAAGEDHLSTSRSRSTGTAGRTGPTVDRTIRQFILSINRVFLEPVRDSHGLSHTGTLNHLLSFSVVA